MDERANSIREDLKKEGYSKEEEYFYHINQELIEKKKQVLKENSPQQKEKSKEQPKPTHSGSPKRI
jgi:hypothetical protein